MGAALILALLIVGLILAGIHQIQARGTSILGWAVIAIDAALLLPAAGLH